MGIARIVVVGSVNTDMVVKTENLPAPGETVTGGEFVLAAGGKGANQAVAAARLGADVTLVAKVGSDLFGDQAVENFSQEGITTDYIQRDTEHSTGVALILVDGHGENLISVASGANHALSADDMVPSKEALRSADVVLLQLEIPMETVLRAAEIADAAGVPVILDPAPAPPAPLTTDLLRLVTYLTPNESEATRLTGVEVHDERTARVAAEKLRETGAKNVIITMGAAGVLLATEHETSFIHGQRVEALDSTAAGDAFNGGLAAALAGGLPLLDAVHEANRVGALTVTRLGAQPSLPTRAELDRYSPSDTGR
jgi:ribokinase